MRLIHYVLRSFIGKFVVVYFHDILVIDRCHFTSKLKELQCRLSNVVLDLLYTKEMYR